jgi:glutamyl-tRNA synthetase
MVFMVGTCWYLCLRYLYWYRSTQISKERVSQERTESKQERTSAFGLVEQFDKKKMLPLTITVLSRMVNQPEYVGKNSLENENGLNLLGEVSLVRYLSKTHREQLYGNSDAFVECEIDLWVDFALQSRITLSQLNESLLPRTFLSGLSFGLADAIVWSFLLVNNLISNDSAVEAFPCVKRWLRTIESYPQISETKKEFLSAAKKKSTPAAATVAGGKKHAHCPILEGNPDPKDVVTRFPPEPSGHLHIGHCKALMLNQYYAREYMGSGGGKLILRFDDTNPAAEKEEYEAAILQDLASLNVVPDVVTHTSDYFDLIEKKAEEMIKKGLAFVDFSTQEELAAQRGGKTGIRIPSPCRDQTVEENLKLWELMKQGKEYEHTDKSKRMCTLRAKVTDIHGTPGYLCGNGSMRDPVLYRVVLDPPHAKCGKKYKMYPTYDMACPIVDSIEDVTHVLRDSQYSDRTEQFEWIQQSLGLRKCYIQQFSRVNFIRTLMSKRKLAALIKDGYADGWDDPRFPTVKGMLRRGMLVDSIKNFMLELGGSLKQVDMEWDKIWSDNMRALDKMAIRFMAVDTESHAKVEITNFAEYHKLSPADVNSTIVSISIPIIPKEPEKGNKSVIVTPVVLLERVDIDGLKSGDVLGLMRYCVTKVESVDVANGTVKVSIMPDGDFRKCDRLVTWVSSSPMEPKIVVWEFDYILKEGKEDDEVDNGGDDWRKNINPVSKISSLLIANAGVRNLQKGDFVQFERRGLFKVDKAFVRDNEMMEFIKVPDGKTKDMSTIKSKLDHR